VAKSNPAKVDDLPVRLIDADTERWVLGNVLSRGAEVWPEVREAVAEDDFAVESNRAIFQLAAAAADAHGSPELGNVYRVLLDRGAERPPFAGTLSELAFDSVRIVNLGPWLRVLRRKAVDRQAYRLSTLIHLRAAEGFSGAVDEIHEAQTKLRALERSLSTDTDRGTIGELVGRVEGGVNGLLVRPSNDALPTPWPRLNFELAGGFRPGQLIVVAARPSVGKSTMALNIAAYNARRDRRARMFSLEMPAEDLLRRLISSEALIEHGFLAAGNLQPAERHRAARILAELDNAPLEIFADVFELTDICARIPATKTGRCELAIVDYIGLIQQHGRHENRNQEISAITRRLKLLAVDHKIPIIALSQLNRSSETESRKPTLADLRDSGSLEQDADVVLLLHAPARERRNRNGGDPNEVTVIVAKQRNGPRDTAVTLHLDGRHCRLVERVNESEMREAS
jgi:replicative DNA helicase